MKVPCTISFLLTAFVLGNAYTHKKHFYPMMVYITKSRPSLAILFFQVIVLLILASKYFGRLFFGEISTYEREALMEKTWHIFTDSCLAFATLKGETTPQFTILLVVFLLLKSAHILTEERISFMERSPVIPNMFHVRMLSLLLILCTFDIYLIDTAALNALAKGLSWNVAFSLEYTILFIICINIIFKYMLHCCELYRLISRETKAMLLLFVECSFGALKESLYIACFIIILILNHHAPLFLIRPIYNTYETIQKAYKAIMLSKRAVIIMNSLFPDATREDIDDFDSPCIICREDLDNGEVSKKLPCNHILHTSCLRLWFQTQQSCPTCRLDVLNISINANTSAQTDRNAHQRQNIDEALGDLNLQNPGPSNTLTSEPSALHFNKLSKYLESSILDQHIPDDIVDLSEEDLKSLAKSSRILLIKKFELLKKVQRIVDSSISLMSKCCESLDNEMLNDATPASIDTSSNTEEHSARLLDEGPSLIRKLSVPEVCHEE